MHTNTSSQKNQHRDILAKKKKKKPKRKNKQTQTEKQKRDKSVLIGTIGARGSRLVGARGYGSWSELGAMDQCSCGSVLLWINACDQSCGSVIGAVDRCLWSELWIGDRSCDDVDWFVTEREKMRQRDRPRGRDRLWRDRRERERNQKIW